MDFSTQPFLYFTVAHYWAAVVFQGTASYKIGISFLKIAPKGRITGHSEILNLLIKTFALDDFLI